MSWVVFAPWFPLIIGIVCLGALLWSSRRRKKTWVQNAEGLQAEFAQTFRTHADARATLWSIIDTAFARRRQVRVDPGLVRESIKKAGFPLDIVRIPQDGSLYNYANSVVKWWDNDRKGFLEFCLVLYQQQGDSPILNPSEFETFDGLCQTLAKFWNEWEIRCSGQSMSIGDIVNPDLIQSQTPDVVMLTYLEVARGLQKKENSRGKQGLFTVARDFYKKSNFM